MTAPLLALDGGKNIGRLYRRPDQPLPTTVRYDDAGRPFLRKRDAEQAVIDGTLVPSITNVIGVRNMPHLVPWAAKKAAQEAIRVAREHPGLMTEKPVQAVDWLKATADRDRDAAAEQGDVVHKACEDLARGLPCPPLTPAQNLYVDSWKAFLDRFQPRFLYLEATVFGRTASGLRYGGTGDFIADIGGYTVGGDYKTTRSGIHAFDVALQLSAIAHADEFSPDNEALEPMPQIDAGVVVHLSQEGFQVAPAVLDGETWDDFCALRQVWAGHVLDGRLSDGTRPVGRVLSRPEQMQEFLRPMARLAATSA